MKMVGFDRRSWLLTLAAAALLCVPAHASIIITALGVTVASGGSGSFDVTIQDPGATQNIASFSLGLSVGASSGITFTGANESTAASYIFVSDSFAASNPPFATVSTHSIEAVDLSNSGNGTNVGATARGLAHILFSVAPGTPGGPVTINVIPDCAMLSSCTSLADSLGASITGFQPTNGVITVTATATTPEPSTWLLSLLAIPVLTRIRRPRKL
jgi:hypothetical protein